MDTKQKTKAESLAAADNLGVISVVYHCLDHTFHYDPDIEEKLMGRYDDRPFLHILQMDGVASENDAAAIMGLMERARTDRSALQEKLLVSLCIASGRFELFTLRIVADYDEAGRAERLHLLFIDVRDESTVNGEIAGKMLRDELTGLMRRKEFLAEVKERVGNAPPSTYIMVCFDVDKFSVINERFGYQLGDTMLRFIADTIADACSREDAICSRLNADHFAICARNDDKIAERFYENYRAALQRAHHEIDISVSFGLCIIDDPSLTPEIILDHATLAQRSIKGSYVTRYAYYDDALRRVRLKRQEIEGQMKTALERGQFDIYIQPQFELATGRLIGGESLVRWFHPDKGVVMPDEFIPIFEQNGFIGELDSFVWERACQQLQKWIAADGENALSLSVNISRVNLFHMAIVDRLCVLTERYGVPPRLLRLEITESAYADNRKQLLDVVCALQARGFTVEMDDFGSGYSSLNTLKDVPVNTLKLDLRFLEGDSTSGRGGSIVNSVIRMTRWLQLPVIAEGVETQRQADYLHSVGCDYVQGYLYAKPMPVAEFESMMRQSPRTAFDADPLQVDMADANAFWNPDSQETLIFNSYVGGAAIVEYADGRVELLRANEKFLGMLHLEDTVHYVYILENALTPEERSRFIEMLDEAIAEAAETTCTICLRDGNTGARGDVWLRNRARVLCRSRDRAIFYIAVEDVTAERKAEERLHVSQDTLMAAVAHTHLQYWTYNLEEHTSIQGVESHGYASGVPAYLENYPQSLIDMGYVHPDHADAYRKLHTDLQAGARTASADVLTGGEGHWEWRKIRYTAVPDSNGAVRSAIGTSESLSAYKELEQRFVIAVQQCGLLIWTIDIPARCIHTDMLAQIGSMKETVIGNMPESFIALGRVHPEDEQAFADLYERMYAGESHADATLRCKDARSGSGGWNWYRMTMTAIVDKDGPTGTVLCTAMNVDEQVNMQRRYREAMSYYEGLDPKDYISMLYANVTKGTVDVPGEGVRPFGHGTEQLIRIADEAERTAMDEALRAETLMREYAKGVSRFKREFRLTCSDGSERWARTTVRLLMDTSKQELCAFIYTQDINDEKMKALIFEHIVLEDYDFVTIIDTQHDRFNAFVTDSGIEFVPSSEEYSFSEAAEVFAKKTAVEEDVALYIRETRLPYMMRRLEEEGSYSFHYRSKQADGASRLKRIALRLIDAHTKYVCLTRLDIENMEK